MRIYPFKKISRTEYAFTSVGIKGHIIKRVSLKPMNSVIYNIVLQDEVEGKLTGDINLTGNGDALAVINTAAQIIEKFLQENPGSMIHFAGNTHQKNLAYARLLMRELDNGLYRILGQTEIGNDFLPIHKLQLINGTYTAFLILPYKMLS